MNVIALWSACLALAAAVGVVIPTPVEGDYVRLIDAFITTMLLIAVWAGFRLVRPVRFARVWVAAEFIAVPVLWTVLVVALSLWFQYLHNAAYPRLLEETQSLL